MTRVENKRHYALREISYRQQTNFTRPPAKKISEATSIWAECNGKSDTLSRDVFF